MTNSNERLTPRISANKLGEYLREPSARRRLRIIQDQKHPKSFIVARYDPAVQAIREHLITGDSSAIEEAIEEQGRQSNNRHNSEWAQIRARNCVEALEAWSEIDPPEIGTLAQGPDSARITIATVSISVRPDIVVAQPGVGCIKLHVSKTTEIDEAGLQLIGVLCSEYLREATGSPPRPRDVVAIDVFKRSVVQAPRATTERLKEIESGCSEIAARWREA